MVYKLPVCVMTKINKTSSQSFSRSEIESLPTNYDFPLGFSRVDSNPTIYLPALKPFNKLIKSNNKHTFCPREDFFTKNGTKEEATSGPTIILSAIESTVADQILGTISVPMFEVSLAIKTETMLAHGNPHEYLLFNSTRIPKRSPGEVPSG